MRARYAQRYGPGHASIRNGAGSGYIDQFIRLRCAPDLLAAKAFPNAKEVTESMGMFTALRSLLGAPSFGWHNVRCVVPGDGVRPRTGALLACMTRWNVEVVDPALRVDQTPLKRLELHRATFDKWLDERSDEGVELTIVAAVHAHCRLDRAWAELPRPLLIVSMPCCVPGRISEVPDRINFDKGIGSPKNEIRAWADGIELQPMPWTGGVVPASPKTKTRPTMSPRPVS